MQNNKHNNMNSKNIFAFLIFAISGMFFYLFVWEFKMQYVDSVSTELTNLENAYAQATEQLSLKTLRLKKQALGEQDLALLQNFIPQNLHSGQFVYNLGQLANQNRLILKGLQYTVIDETVTNPNGERKLQVEFTMDGRYEDFLSWLQRVERSNVLVDVESIRGVKTSNNSDIVSFNVKMYAYGININ